jgi:site-specific recombinase XerD
METYEHRKPWNKGKLVGQKAPLKPKDIWAVRLHLQNTHQVQGLAMFNLAIDSKLRGCDLVNLRVRDVTHGSQIRSRAMVLQRKTQRPVQFELTEPTRIAVAAWIAKANLKSEDFSFPSRLHGSPHISTRQYARIVERWVSAAGLDTSAYGTHSMRRTKATLIYKRTTNLRAVQLLLGPSKLDYLRRRTMSGGVVLGQGTWVRRGGHSPLRHRLWRKARSLSSGRYRLCAR